MNTCSVPTQVFRAGEKNRLAAHIQTVLDTDPQTLAKREAQSLIHLFNACAQLLAPLRSSITAKNLQQLVVNSARMYQAIILNRPIIIDEDMFEGSRNTFIKFGHDFKRGEGDVYASTGAIPKRMFGIAGFNFLILRDSYKTDRKDNPNVVTTTLPYVTLPNEFLNIVYDNASFNLLDAFQDMCMWSDHDWFHNFTMGHPTLNDVFTNEDKNVPAYQHLYYKMAGENVRHLGDRSGPSSALNEAVHKGTLDGRTDGYDGFEAWAMRLHRLMMTKYLDKTSNRFIRFFSTPLERSMNNYLKAWKKFHEKTKHMPAMGNPKTTPSSYAAKLFAYNMFRIAPLKHPAVQKILNSPLLNTDERAILKSSFEDTYNHWYKRVLDGAGERERWMQKPVTQEHVDTYEDGVMRASAHALELAMQDANYVRDEMVKPAQPAKRSVLTIVS